MTVPQHPLPELGLKSHNPACSSGPGGWSNPGDILASINPATGEPLARLGSGTDEDYENVVCRASDAWQQWRQWPAPRRGDVVRRIANKLRLHKDELGTLVSLETGKIKQEGDGEVQEMIDIADLAVGPGVGSAEGEV